jgi:transcriptional regulator with XRE-family HTH domain
MRKYGLTQKRTARDLNVTETWVSLVIHRKGKSMRVLKYISKRTNTPVEHLLNQNKKAA